MGSKLDELKKLTVVVADSGDIDAIKQYKPQDATTNPSLIYKAAQMSEHQDLIQDAVSWAQTHCHHASEILEKTIVKLFVNFGSAILKIVPGRVSTEVDARLSLDIQGSIDRAHEYIALYEELGIPKERILIKLASTWEGIQAAKVLEKEGIHCNMTLMFHLAQAIAAAEAGATLISPFVGRIYDWQKKAEGRDSIPATEDLGVQSVHSIFHYYKHFNYKTQIMGASFRNIDEILELAGCDLLTIAPDLLQKLSDTTGTVPRKLDPKESLKMKIDKITIDEKIFRQQIRDSAMATEKLFEGIDNFTKDTIKLESYVNDHFLKGKRPTSQSM